MYNQSLSSFTYQDTERQRIADFLARQKSERDAFINECMSRRQKFMKELGQLNTATNPFRLFRLPETFTLEELRQRYKELSRVTHPDKPTGSKVKFQLVTKCYLYLYELYKSRHQPRAPSVAGRGATTNSREVPQLEGPSPPPPSPPVQNGPPKIFYNKDSFDTQLFNKIYEENRIFDYNDEGYGEWLSGEGATREKDPEIRKPPPELFGEKFNLNVFNRVFEEERKQRIVRREDSTAAAAGATEITAYQTGGFAMLDYRRPDDYSSGVNERLQYTDLKRGYEQSYLVDFDESAVARPQFRSLEQYEKHRETVMGRPRTREEIELEEYTKRKTEQEERARRERMQQRDWELHQHSERVRYNLLK